ncbi:MAG: HNH/ENDO VII family nuclease [Neptuniibacter sp.]
MWRLPQTCFLLIFALISFAPEVDGAKYGGYNSYSSYNSYRNNNYYRQQQTYRNNQAIQRQNQMNMARQRNEQMRMQREATRKSQMLQQQRIRDQRMAMQKQMKVKQQKAIQQQTQRMQLQRQKMLDKQKMSGKIKGGQLAKFQKNIQQQQQLREQNKLKDRQKKLEILAKKLNRDKINKKNKAEREKTLTFAALASSTKTSFQSTSVNTKTFKDFKSNRALQASKAKVTDSLDKSRLTIKSKAEKANLLKKQLFAKANSGGGGKKPPGKVVAGDDGGEKSKKLSPIFNKAANYFNSCKEYGCNTKQKDNSLIKTSAAGKTVRDNKFFTKKVKYKAPENGTGYKYTVYQQKIDWGLKYKGKTNLQLAEDGKAPYILKDGKLVKIHLHHSRQNGRGSLFEVSEISHRAKSYQGGRALHPFGKSQHPDNPVKRLKFRTDRENYWKQRAKKEREKKLG